MPNPIDLVISSGIVVDGSQGAVPTVSDVGIDRGLIIDVGDLSSRARRVTFDARERVVAPGFIDTHSHGEIAAISRSPDRMALVRQGVTTTLVGADGFGWVAFDAATERRWWKDMASIYGARSRCIPRWSRPIDFISDLKEASPTDVLPLVPHGNVRASIMGFTSKSPSPLERRAMLQLTREWLDAGAVGLATGLDYLPGRYADTQEIIELCHAVVERGGVYASHLRYQDLGRAGAWEEINAIGRTTGIPLRISHEKLDEEGSRLLDDVSAGNDLAFDTYLYPAGSSALTLHVPKEMIGDGVCALSDRLNVDRELGVELAEVLTARVDRRSILAATTSHRDEGRTLEELSAERGITVGEVAVELLRIESPCVLMVFMWPFTAAQWDEVTRATLQDDRSMIATDGVYVGSAPHPRGFGTYPRILGELVRDRGLASMSQAVHKMTGKPAAAYGLADRGKIAPGLRADLVVFDPGEISGPAAFGRPRLPPQGIELVLVGGAEREIHN